jgi:1-acyl-sn-glycerol-3-phosphate acyltransferase
MIHLLARLIYAIAGWKITGTIPKDIKHCIVLMAPHTSNWDFVIGFLGFAILRIKSHSLIKKEAFRFPLGIIVRAMGGVAVDRKHASNVVISVAHEFHKRKQFILIIAPEGTRSLNHHWKRGFYNIAVLAKVPIIFGYLDYTHKEAGLADVFIPTGNYESDMAIIEDFYAQKTARFPEKFNLSPINRKKHHPVDAYNQDSDT